MGDLWGSRETGATCGSARLRSPVLLLLPLIVLAGLATTAAAGKPGPLTVVNSRQIVISITPMTELRFGSVVLTSASGEVTVPVSGLPTYLGIFRAGGSTGPARVELRGEPNKTIQVTIVSPTTG